ncbi:hypothetical protein ABBQ32_009813 [Trebouxia sp. C0010 RCD-2024]
MLGPGGTMSGMYFDDARGLRKKNRKWKLLQPYLPYVGWGLLTLVTIVLAYREYRLSNANNVRKEQSITQLSSRLTKSERDLKSSHTRFQEEMKLLTSREEELLKAKAESIAAHAELQEKHSQTQQEHSSVAEKASSCDQNLSKANQRVEELSKMLNQQHDVAAELKRNLEAEAALHTQKEKQWQSTEADLRRQLSGLEEHHASCTTNSSTGHIHADKSSSTASKIIETVSNALPSREVLQQAHPGVAAAAGLLLGQASSNKAGDQDGSKLNSQPAQAASNTPVSAERGQDSIGEIPWRQVAGLLHAQGITDPQGLGHMSETLKTFVGARLAVDKERSSTAADMSAEDNALVSLLAGAGISDPNGRAHFVQALREHLLASGSQAVPATASAEAEASQAEPDTTGQDSSPGKLQDGGGIQPGSINQNTEPTKKPHVHHGIPSHGHRAFLIDDSNPAAVSANKRPDHVRKQQ